MIEYNKEELRKRRPLNFIAMAITVFFILFAFYLMTK
tara:strand:- start:1950 stop:2060 length:111 start_codon:yes stop_codon:yes gene_type:complete